MLSKIKKHFLNKHLFENKIDPHKAMISLQRAKSIGLLCEITDENSYKDIFSLFTKLQNPGRTVWLMGYINDKVVPFFCLQQLSADYFCNKDLNWYGKPNLVQVDDFIARNFDMLIDFTKNNVSPIQYILSLSKASCKVGRSLSNKELYDLHIKIDTSNHYNFLENIYIYTKKLTGE